jgi:hypothetical protein
MTDWEPIAAFAILALIVICTALLPPSDRN